MAHEASHNESDEFFIRFKGDAKPYNSPLEILKNTYDRIPLTKEARERFEELFLELGSLAVKKNRWQKIDTASSYIANTLNNESKIFYVVVEGDAEPYNNIAEIIDDIELKLSLDNPSNHQD